MKTIDEIALEVAKETPYDLRSPHGVQERWIKDFAHKFLAAMKEQMEPVDGTDTDFEKVWDEAYDFAKRTIPNPFPPDCDAYWGYIGWTLARTFNATPPGWKLVPVSATTEIRNALRTGSRKDYPSDELCNVRWAAAIAAAPTPEGEK